MTDGQPEIILTRLRQVVVHGGSRYVAVPPDWLCPRVGNTPAYATVQQHQDGTLTIRPFIGPTHTDQNRARTHELDRLET